MSGLPLAALPHDSQRAVCGFAASEVVCSQRTDLKETLTRLFRNYGKVLDVTAHKNMRMRGQAFVTLDHPAKAAKAIRELQRLPLYGKALVRQCDVDAS